MSHTDVLKQKPQLRHHNCRMKEKLHYKCQVCNKHCNTELCLKLHMQCHKHCKAGLYRCSVCHFTFTKKHVLHSHIHQVHFKDRWKNCHDNDTVPQCMCCQQRFSSLFDLQKHLAPTLSQFPSLSEWVTKKQLLNNRIKDPSHVLHANSDRTMKFKDHSNNIVLKKRITSVENKLSQGKKNDLSLVPSVNENLGISQGHDKVTCFNSNNHSGMMQQSNSITRPHSRSVNFKYQNCIKNGQLQMQDKSVHLNQTHKTSSSNVDDCDSDSSLEDTEFVNLLKAVFKEDSVDEDSDSSELPSYSDDHQYGQEKIGHHQNGLENQSALDDPEDATGSMKLLDDVRNASGPLKKMLHFLQTHSFIDRRRGLFKCSPCQSAFSSETQLLDHFHVHFCHICGSTFEKKISVKFHLSQHKAGHRTRQPSIKKFDGTFIQDMFQKCTVISDSGKRFTCSMCQRHSSQRSCLFIHMYTHAQNLNSSPAQESSMHSVPGNSDSTDSRERMFPCTKCEKSFFSMNNLRGHMETHEETHKFLCSVCGRGFRRRRAMLKHLELHSPDKIPPKLMVKLAERNQSSSLKKDIPPPHSPPAYKKQLTSSSGHFVVAACFTPRKLDPEPASDVEGDFVCQICRKGFHARKNLRMHMQVHGPKKFVCSKCNKSFRKRLSLEQHKCRL